MHKKVSFFAFLMLAAASGITADNIYRCIPFGYVWIATPCDTWNCEQAAMILANGDLFVISLPTSSAIDE